MDEKKVPSNINKKELQKEMFANIFEHVVDKLTSGIPLHKAIQNDIRPISLSLFLKWIHRDDDLRARYEEAQKFGAEVLAAEILEISDSVQDDSEIQMAKLRIDARKHLTKVWNKEKYGDTKNVNITGSFSMLEVLKEARGRVIDVSHVENEDDEKDLE